MINLIPAIILASAGFSACNPAPEVNHEIPDKPFENGKATAYITTADGKRLFESTEIPFISLEDPAQAPLIVNIDAKTEYQEIDGFGAALTGASCYNLLKMSQEGRTAFLKEIFDTKEGLGMSLVRVSIGASDFSVDDEFTWCDTEGLENFAIHKEDRDYLIPILKEVYAINPGLKIVASPWSAPRWMKRRSTTDESPYLSWTSGSLAPKYYQAYAEYFVKWIQTM